MARAHNFYAGPAVLPEPALQAGVEALRDYKGIGMSVIEISHRSKEFTEIIETTEADIRELMNIPDNYHVLFMTGGASTQFALIPMTFLKRKADYVDTGAWSTKAIKEAVRFGEVHLAGSGKEGGYTRIPDSLDLSPDADYVHVTSNNTIYGTQWSEFPDTGDVPLVCDMSSDILCREIDVTKFALIYAGAQKNMGPAGVTVVILRDDLLQRVPAELPTMFKYTTYAEKKSLFNTPPVFPIFMVGQVAKWLKGIGGVKEIERRNREKAAMLYDVLDRYDIYRPHAHPSSRSLMNVTWRMTDEKLEAELLAAAAERRMFGLKGHRSVGGLRASIYNACPVESVKALCDLLVEFAESH